MTGAVKTRSRVIPLLRRWWMILLLPLAGALVLAARQSSALTERLYSSGLYRILAGVIGGITSLLPFSLVELVICLMIVAVIFLLIKGTVRMVKVVRHRAEPVKMNWKRLGELVLKLVCCIAFAFVILCGLNYYRPEFASFSGLTVRESSVNELVALCTELTNRANELRKQVTLDENGVTILADSSFAAAREAKAAFGRLGEQYSVLPDLPITPKPVLNSWWMSMMQITGVFSPYTYEANVNIASPDYSIPATMCHELAHTRGFMREDEANFIGYLACNKSDSPDFQYSGVMLALVHSINRLYTVDNQAFEQVCEQLSEGVRLDFAYNNAYWARHEGPVAKVSNAVNDTYLRMNNQSDGVQSYGRMVDLLLADYRVRHNLT
ncbi:DUF3810 domain-containing protein [Oscillospiraceae bacterium PP1C4]